MKFIKFHLLDHLADDLLRNGVCQNTTSGPSETRHKFHCKRPAKNTQRIVSLFDNQVAAQYANSIVIDRATSEIELKTCVNKASVVSASTPKLSSPRFFYENEKLYDLHHKAADGTFKLVDKWPDMKAQRDILNLIKDAIAPYTSQKRITLFTVCKHNNVIYRANPIYQKNKAWNDWAYLSGNTNEELFPAHFQIFLEVTDLVEEKAISEDCLVNTNGIFAICHMLPVPLTDKPIQKQWGDNHLAHQGSMLFYYSQKDLVGRRKPLMPQYYVSNLNQIRLPCIAVPDTDADEPHSFLFMRSRSDWLTVFTDHMKKEIEQKRNEQETNQLRQQSKTGRNNKRSK
jgi:hypothetical protein